MLSANKKFSSVSLLSYIMLILTVFFTVVSIYVPFSPWMPAQGLDPSWVFSLNQAVAQNLSFGLDLIYTFGPYAALWTHQYHPETDVLTLYTGFYFAICFSLCFILVFNTRKWFFGILILWVLMTSPTDVGFFFYSLMVALLSFKLIYLSEAKTKNKILAPSIAIIFSAFGLMFLIKATFFLIFVPITILSAILFFFNKSRALAITILFSPLVSVFFFWVLSGQTGSLLDYFLASIAIISGYSAAMSSPGSSYEVSVFVVSAIFLFISILTEKSLTLNARFFLGICFSLFLFLSFKEGFVRHDAHALVAGYSLLVCALCLCAVVSISRILVIGSFCLAILSALFIIHDYESIRPFNLISKIENNYVAVWKGLSLRTHDPSTLEDQFNNSLFNLKQQALFPVWAGTTDIYSYNQAWLIASGNIWAPRPIFQSFQAYSKKLAEMNKAYLLSDKAPEHIIFRVETIDNRLPSMDDGASWPILLSQYKAEGEKNDFLYLHRKRNCRFIDTIAPAPYETASMGKWVDLSGTAHLVYAKIIIHPSMLGKIRELLYKPTQLTIKIKLNDNSEREFRLIAGMSESGFIISPLVENTEEFNSLYKGEIKTSKIVKSIKISTEKNENMFWHKSYKITFNEFSPRTACPLLKN